LSGGIRRVIVANRTVGRAQALIASFEGNLQACGWADIPDALPGAGLVVNTTALGMKGHDGDDAWIDLAPARDNAIVTDIVYVPLETPFLRSARQRHLVTVDGLGMLLHQAVPGFERWFGVRPQVDAALREHMLATLAARDRQP
jgi:shikimate dehydrogenase